jgi:hypothetical protein
MLRESAKEQFVPKCEPKHVPKAQSRFKVTTGLFGARPDARFHLVSGLRFEKIEWSREKRQFTKAIVIGL